eukprot:1023247-Rhodomonas_salina.1
MLLCYQPTRVTCHAWYCASVCVYALRDMRYSARVSRYARSVGCAVLSWSMPHTVCCYGMCGTELEYGATQLERRHGTL